VFACLFMALYTRMLRANVLEALTAEHVRIARAKGAPDRTVVIRHVLRNVLLPLVTMLGMDIPVALGGAIYTEVVFSLPGLGLYAWQALQHEDYTLLQGIVIFTSCWVIIANLVVDLLYALVDPRIRLA
jgi:peptide/nickel transport system permease protein